jgi:hypothetical protein
VGIWDGDKLLDVAEPVDPLDVLEINCEVAEAESDNETEIEALESGDDEELGGAEGEFLDTAALVGTDIVGADEGRDLLGDADALVGRDFVGACAELDGGAGLVPAVDW